METYGIFKHLATENYYTAMSKCINSAVNTQQTQKSLKRITKNNIVYAHMGQLIISDGICYASFIQNTGNDGENHNSTTSGVVLAVFTLEAVSSDSFDAERDVEIYPVGGKGDLCAGQRACSIFKDNSMCLVGDALYVCFSFIAEDGRSHIFRKIFDIKEKVWRDDVMAVLEYNGKTYDFSDESLNIIYCDKGLAPRAKGLIELVTAWNEYEGEYYATGVTIDGPNNGFIVKTSDFKTMTLVDVVPFNDMGTAEIASHIYLGRLYVACRQDYGIPYLYFSYLDLKTMQWTHHYKLQDGNVRPWFFEYRGELYLLNTIEEYHRRYTNISRVRAEDCPFGFYNRHRPVEIVATIKDCGSYFAVYPYNDDVYFVSTLNTESFGKLSMHTFDPDAVNQKLAELFGMQ